MQQKDMKKTDLNIWLNLAEHVARSNVEPSEAVVNMLRSTVLELTKIARQLIKKKEVNKIRLPRSDKKTERNAVIAGEVQAGQSQREVAKKYGITSARVSQIYRQYYDRF